jgi:hypothetical protein
MTERQEVILAEGTAAWIAEKMELPEGQAYDPGLTWDEIGVDLLIVDEAQNFKNLYTPERRDGGIPKFVGGSGEGSNRAWQLDFRCASVRRRAGGLLSASPRSSPARAAHRWGRDPGERGRSGRARWRGRGWRRGSAGGR